MDADDPYRNLSEKDILYELLSESRPVPVLNDWELEAGYAACKKCIEIAKAKAPPPFTFHLQFDCANRLGYKEEAKKIVIDYDATMEMYLRSGKCFFDNMDFHRARDDIGRAIAFAEDPITEQREHIIYSCRQLLNKVNASSSLLEDTSTQPKNEDKKKKKKKEEKKKKKKQQPLGSSHQQIPASTSHPKECHEEQQLSDMVLASSSSHPKEYHEEQQLFDMVIASSSHPMQFYDHDEEDLYIGKHLDMNEHLKIWVDFQDKNGMFHGKMQITSKHLKEVSFIPLLNEKTDLDLFDFLYNSVDGFTLRVFVLLEHPRHSYIVAERVSLAYSFFEREQSISPTFQKVFRIIMHGFIVLIRKGKSIRDFQRCAFVTTKGVEGRVLPSLSLDLRKDLPSYHDFLVELLEHVGIPEILEPYLIELKRFEPDYHSTEDAQLLVDCPLFWCSSERINFINTLFGELKSGKWNLSLFHLAIKQLTECSWIYSWKARIQSKTKTVLLKIFEYPLQFVDLENDSAHPLPYCDVGYDLVRYIIAVYHHYNDKMYTRLRKYQILEKEEIEQLLYDVFPELYISLMAVVREIIKNAKTDDNIWIKFLSVRN